MKLPFGANFVTHDQGDIWKGLRDKVGELYNEGKHMQAAQMHDALWTQVPLPWLTLPSARELHNEISAITHRRKKEA